MSNYDINNNLKLVNLMIENEKKAEEEYYIEYPDSLIPLFENELRKLGYEFEVSSQVVGFMPKHKETILPIAIKFYKQAKEKAKYNEQNYFLDFFHFKGFEEVVPMLLEDFTSIGTPEFIRWSISDVLYQIRDKNHVGDYLKILLNSEYGINRQMIVLLIGKLKSEEAISILIDLLDDEDITGHIIYALGNYKRPEFRMYFERFLTHKNKFYLKEAEKALKKIK